MGHRRKTSKLFCHRSLVEEGIIRRLEPFLRVLKVIGIYNAQILNIENIARESHVGRTTVDKYFQIIEETLIGFRLHPLRAKWNQRELIHPKFYLFDAGVARGCAGLLSEELDASWSGFSFETLIVNEVRAFNAYLKNQCELFYYKYSGGYEIDLLIETGKKTLSKKQKLTAIEVKSSKRWDPRWNAPLLDLQKKSKGRVQRLIGIYRGKQRLTFGEIEIYPAEEFLTLLSQGEFFKSI